MLPLWSLPCNPQVPFACQDLFCSYEESKVFAGDFFPMMGIFHVLNVLFFFLWLQPGLFNGHTFDIISAFQVPVLHLS